MQKVLSIINPSFTSPLHIQDPKLVITVPADELPPIGGRPSAGTVLTKKLDVYSASYFCLLMIPFKPNGILWSIQLNLIIFHNTHCVSIEYLDNYFSLFMIPYHITDQMTSSEMANEILQYHTEFNELILKICYLCQCETFVHTIYSELQIKFQDQGHCVSYYLSESLIQITEFCGIRRIQDTWNPLNGPRMVFLCLWPSALPNKIQGWLMLPNCHVAMVTTEYDHNHNT